MGEEIKVEGEERLIYVGIMLPFGSLKRTSCKVYSDVVSLWMPKAQNSLNAAAVFGKFWVNNEDWQKFPMRALCLRLSTAQQLFVQKILHKIAKITLNFRIVLTSK